MMLKKSASSYWKVKVEVKAENKRAFSTLNLNLDLSLLQMLRLCWPGFRSMGMLILFFVVLMGGAPSHESNAMEATPAAPKSDEWRPLVDSGYRLGAEDVMLVSVWKDEHLTKEVVVRPDGMFSFPLVGDIQAEDCTVEEVRAELVKRLTKYIPNPNVSVAVTKILSYKVYVV